MTDGGTHRRRRLIVAMVLIVGLVLVAVAAGIFGAPRVSDVENRFGGVNQSTTVIETDLTVANPNPIGASLGGVTVNYTVSLNDVQMATGTKTGVRVGAGTTTVPFRTTMRNEQIPVWWVRHVMDGEHSVLRVRADVRSATLGRSARFTPVDRNVTTDILSSFNSTERRPVNANLPVVDDPVLYINETSATWGDISRRETPVPMAFTVYNPKPVPYTITEIGYTITMNGIEVGEGTSEEAVTIPPGSTTTIDTTTALTNDRLDEWWVSHLERNQRTDLRVQFYARVDLPTGTVRVPLDALTYTETIETDIFGTKPQGGSPESNPTDRTATPDGAGDPSTSPQTTVPRGAEDSTPNPEGTDREPATETDGDLLPIDNDTDASGVLD